MFCAVWKTLQQQDEGDLMGGPEIPPLDVGDADGFYGASSPQGGVSDEVTLSAYITAALLEMNMTATVSTPRC